MIARAPARGAVLALALASAGVARGAAHVDLDIRKFQPVEGPSTGPAVYYAVVETPDGPLLRGTYRPGLETVTMGIQVPDQLRKRARLLRWRWRARAHPVGGNECRPRFGDSTASVAAAFKRGLRWYVLKFVWSPVAPLGAVCDRKRTVFLVRDTIVLESGGKPGIWFNEVVDLRRAFIDHFEDGDPNAEVPDLVGVAVMTDGDQTQTEASADWTGFQLEQ